MCFIRLGEHPILDSEQRIREAICFTIMCFLFFFETLKYKSPKVYVLYI